MERGNTKQEILNAALDLFSVQGFEATSISQIANAVGIRKASLYSHFSWDYLCYVRKHPIEWSIPTCILYGGKDHLTSRETISGFAEQIGANLTIMEDGEHWFHTEEQMKFLDHWMRSSLRSLHQ